MRYTECTSGGRKNQSLHPGAVAAAVPSIPSPSYPLLLHLQLLEIIMFEPCRHFRDHVGGLHLADAQQVQLLDPTVQLLKEKLIHDTGPRPNTCMECTKGQTAW